MRVHKVTCTHQTHARVSTIIRPDEVSETPQERIRISGQTSVKVSTSINSNANLSEFKPRNRKMVNEGALNSSKASRLSITKKTD